MILNNYRKPWKTAGLGASVAATLTFILLVGLGSWQVQRLFWKQGIIDERQTGSSAAALELPERAPEIKGLMWRRVTVTGRFLHDQELYLAARSLRGKVGVQVLTSFVRDTGQTVLVNRGWVPAVLKDSSRRGAGQIAGTLTLEGIVTPGARKGWFTPDNDPARGLWLWADLAAMAQTIGRPLQPLVLDADDTPNPGGFPIGGQTRIDIPNDHLQYAFIWFALAAALLVIFVLYSRDPDPAEDET